jgi:hypothetical protein
MMPQGASRQSIPHFVPPQSVLAHAIDYADKALRSLLPNA